MEVTVLVCHSTVPLSCVVLCCRFEALHLPSCPVAQLVEHLLRVCLDVECHGSNPTRAALFSLIKKELFWVYCVSFALTSMVQCLYTQTAERAGRVCSSQLCEGGGPTENNKDSQEKGDGVCPCKGKYSGGLKQSIKPV